MTTFEGSVVALTLLVPHDSYLLLRELAAAKGTTTEAMLTGEAINRAKRSQQARVRTIQNMVEAGRADWQIASALDLTNAQVAVERRKLGLPSNRVPRTTPQPRRKNR